MAVTISSTLAAHQVSNARRPALHIEAAAKRGDVDILDWSRTYTGAESSAPHAAALTPSGIRRVRNDAGTLRVAGDDGTWSAIGACSSSSPVALAARTGELIAISCSNSGKTLQRWTSADDGTTWSAATSIVTESSAVGSVALAFSPFGDACLFYAIGTGTTLKRLRRSSGTWASSGTSWSRASSVASVTGLAAAHTGSDYGLILTGTTATTALPTTWGVLMGDGALPANAWSGLRVIVQADAGSSISYGAPSLAVISADVHAVFVQSESAHVAAARVMYAHPAHFAGILSEWSEPAPLDYTGSRGLAITGDAGNAYATAPDAVYAAELGGSADLSADVLALRWDITPTSAKCELTLAAPGREPPAVPVGLGWTISISHGYHSGTAGAAEYGLILEFVVSRTRSVLAKGERHIMIEAEGPWEQLARWRAPQTWQDDNATRSDVAARIAARSGIAISAADLPASWGEDYPASFTAAESGKTALQRVMLGTEVGALPRSSMTIRGLSADDSQDWELDQIANFERIDEEPAPNWVRLQGDGRYADAVDAESVTRSGPALALITDLSADTDVKATAHAAAELRKAQVLARKGALTIPFHAGIELWDVIGLTESRYGLDSDTFRVVALSARFDRSSAKVARFDTIATLGSV